MDPTETQDVSEESQVSFSSPNIREKLESTNNKILYLIRKVNQLSKSRNGKDGSTVDPERMRVLARKLGRIGLSIEYTDGRGCIKLRADDKRGLDNLKRLNTIFSIETVESFLENVIR